MKQKSTKKGFTKIENDILDAVILKYTRSREIRVIWFIIRLTYGCQQEWVRLKNSDLQTIGILPVNAGKTLQNLLQKHIILQQGHNQYKLNEAIIVDNLLENERPKLERLNKLIGQQISYQNNKNIIINTSIAILSNQENYAYQIDNPQQNVLASKNNYFSTSKDILKKNKYSDKESIADKKILETDTKQSQLVDPYSFSPQNNEQYVALEAWRKLDAQHPGSFNFYLWSVHRVPTSIYSQFIHEIEQDQTIKSKGAVFTHKVMEYLLIHKLV